MIVKPAIETSNGKIGFWSGADGEWYLAAQEHNNSYIERVDICLTAETIELLVTQLMELGEHMRVNDDD